jgi:tRNA(His) 5'-end guanylyltransferase
MDKTAIELCKNIQGAKLAYVQSDEISILMTDFDDVRTSAWFDGNIQKIVSVSASIATSAFNSTHTSICSGVKHQANFDSRVFTIPERHEVMNYFIWRQKDAVRNSIQMVAQSLYSHKELQNKSTNDLQEMIFQKGINWNDYDDGLKRGRIAVKCKYFKDEVERTQWDIINPPIFTKDKEFLDNLIIKNI